MLRHTTNQQQKISQHQRGKKWINVRDPVNAAHDLFHAKGVVNLQRAPVHRNNIVGLRVLANRSWNNQLLLVLPFRLAGNVLLFRFYRDFAPLAANVLREACRHFKSIRRR